MTETEVELKLYNGKKWIWITYPFHGRTWPKEGQVLSPFLVLQKRDALLDQKDNNLLTKQKEMQDKEAKIDEMLKNEMEQLESIAKFSKEKAHDLIMKRVEESMALEMADYIKEQETEAKLKANEIAKGLIVASMQRYANDVTSEHLLLIFEKVKQEIPEMVKRNLVEVEEFHRKVYEERKVFLGEKKNILEKY